tara:strand:- start:19552 stop:19992 length:441 start_codon:yes stop_codon:yes gene_type:complete
MSDADAKMAERAEATRIAIAHSTGTSGYTKACGINLQLLCTDGVLGVADAAQAYWLIDIVGSLKYDAAAASYMEVAKKERRLIVCKLSVNEDRTATFTARGMDLEEDFYTQEIPYTNFPLEEITLWYNLHDHAGSGYTVLYLPSEH